MKPVALTDDQLAQVQRCAQPLNPHDRGAYLEKVAEMLNGRKSATAWLDG
jgi:hypothetical protein